jgi:hypothetical protein
VSVVAAITAVDGAPVSLVRVLMVVPVVPAFEMVMSAQVPIGEKKEFIRL